LLSYLVPVKMATGESFLKWLNIKLRELKTDENVYGSYMIGILEGDEPIEEKREALEEILSQIVEDDIEANLQSIIDKWQQCNTKVEEPPKVIEDVDAKLAKLMESNSIATTVTRQQYTPEQLRIREQILAQYSQVELDECEDDDVPTGPTAASSDPIMAKKQMQVMWLNLPKIAGNRRNWTVKRKRIRTRKTGRSKNKCAKRKRRNGKRLKANGERGSGVHQKTTILSSFFFCLKIPI